MYHPEYIVAIYQACNISAHVVKQYLRGKRAAYIHVTS